MRVQLGFIVLSFLLLSACDISTEVSLDNAIFHDQFVPGQTGNWLVEGDESGRAAIIDEQLNIEVDAPQLIHYVTLDEPSFDDFILQVDVTRVAGELESSSGVLFRMQAAQQFYRFDITGNGFYLIERRNVDGSWTRFLEDWTESAAINTGLNATNRLKVKAEGPNLAFYVNDQMLLQATDASYVTGKIALAAGTFGRPGTHVAFDNVIVTRP
jgi:hypothetical protein